MHVAAADDARVMRARRRELREINDDTCARARRLPMTIRRTLLMLTFR